MGSGTENGRLSIVYITIILSPIIYKASPQITPSHTLTRSNYLSTRLTYYLQVRNSLQVAYFQKVLKKALQVVLALGLERFSKVQVK
jgi:hypothetical protein